MAISLPIVSKFDDKGVNQAEGALDRLGGFAKGAGLAIGAAFVAASAAAVAFGAASLKAAAEAESVTRGLENAVKNANQFGDTAASIGKATEALDKHSTKLAELSGIDDEIINQIKTGWLAVPSLAAMGTDGINKLADVVADTAAGTGKDVQAIGLAFQRVAGDTENAFSKLTRAGIVFTDEQKATFDSILQTNGEMAAQQYLVDQLGQKYAGAAEAAANPFARLQVIFENLKETVGAAMLPAIEKLVPIIQTFISNLTASPEFQAFLDALAVAFNALIEALMPLLPILLDMITTLLPPLANLVTMLAPVVVTLMQAFAPLIPVFAQIINMLMPIVQMLLPPLLQIINLLAPVVMKLINAFMPLIEKILPPLLSLLLAVLSPLVALLETVLPGLVPVIDAFAKSMIWLSDNVLKPLVNVLTQVINGLAALFGYNGKTVNVNASVPKSITGAPVKLAEGGIVMPRPGGTLATIGEAGQAEAVIPLDRLGSLSGGRGGNITVNVTAGMGTDGAALGEQIVNAIRRYERTSGAVFARA